MQEESRCGSRGEQERVVRVESEGVDRGLIVALLAVSSRPYGLTEDSLPYRL